MQGIEFRIDRSDHRQVEKFLDAAPLGVRAIRVDAKNSSFQGDAASAATAFGISVLVEPQTERFLDDGFKPDRLSYAGWYKPDLATLASDRGEQARFAEAVLAHQVDFATALTPPHFFVDSSDILEINIALVRQAVAIFGGEKPIRPIVAVSSKLLARSASEIAQRYRGSGVKEIELRISPFGGDDLGPVVIRRAFEALAVLRDAGLSVTLGQSGLAGMAAMAIGLVDGFSSGIGFRENFNHTSAMSSQRAAARAAEDPDYSPSAADHAGVILPGSDWVTRPRVAKTLYGIPEVRTMLACPLGQCAHSLDGPLTDRKIHFMHTRAAQTSALLRAPAAWRPTKLRNQLESTRVARLTLAKHLPPDVPAPKSRTLDSLIDEIERRTASSAA